MVHKCVGALLVTMAVLLARMDFLYFMVPKMCKPSLIYWPKMASCEMPHFIAHTPVEFEIQLRRVTRSAVFACFVPVSHCFSTLGRMQIELRPQQLACPTLSLILRSRSKFSFAA